MFLPLRTPSTISVAARRASIDTSGSEAPGANQAYSAAALPTNVACTWGPVRMRPGTMVVAVIPVPARSADRPRV